MSRIIERANLRYAVCLFVCLLATTAMCVGQQPGQLGRAIPFRRVFIPEKELETLDTEVFESIDAKELENLAKEYTRKREAAELSSASQGNSKSRLLSTHYVAKLVGADLVSERSRLTVSKSATVGERITLQPWSIAVSPKSIPLPGVASSATDLSSRSEFANATWTFDEQGAPRVPAYESEADRSSLADVPPGEVVHWFGWSTRSDTNSLPNKLQFSFAVPRCVDSFLILALPPQAVVVDSATVAMPIAQWSDVSSRIGDWSELSRLSPDGTGVSRVQESLWIIELGGSQRASFSISLGADANPLSSLSDNEAYKYSQLVKSQRLEHTVDSYEIRTTSEAELLVSQNRSNPIRLSLAPGSRLRRLLVNQQEVDWQVYNGWIQWNSAVPKTDTGEAAVSSNGRSGLNSQSSVYVSAEFVTPIAHDKLTEIETPRIKFDRGYVMSGSTKVQTTSPWLLADAHCESGRVVEAASDAKTTKVSSLEYTWHAFPPVFSIGLTHDISSRRCEMLTRFANEVQGTSAVVRAKLYFMEQDSNFTTFEVAPGWLIRSATVLNPKDPATVFVSASNLDAPTKVQLNWSNLQANRVAELELQLYKSSDPTNREEHLRTVSIGAMVLTPGWERLDVIAAEDSNAFRIRLREDMLQHSIDEDSVVEWQKSLLPRSAKNYLFRSSNAAIDFPQLSWVGSPNLHSSRIKADIQRESASTLSTIYEIRVDLAANRNQPLQIELPSESVRWRVLDDKQWIALKPLEQDPILQPKEVGRWLFDVSSFGNSCTLQAIVSTAMGDDVEAKIPIPRVIDSESEMMQVKNVAENVVLRGVDPHGVWSMDFDGNKILSVDPTIGESALIVKSYPRSSPFDEVGMHAELNLGIDTNGCQKALLVIKSAASISDTLVIKLEEGWSPLEVKQELGGSSWSVPFVLEERKLSVRPREFHQGQSESSIASVFATTTFHIELAGPVLHNPDSGMISNAPIVGRWPLFTSEPKWQNESRRLWLPRELSVRSAGMLSENSHGDLRDRWLVRSWFDSVTLSLFGWKKQVQGPLLFSERTGLDQLVPKGFSSQWYIAMETSGEQIDTTQATNASQFQIYSTDFERSLATCLFAICALLTPRLLQTRFRFATLLFGVAIVLAHVDIFESGKYATPCFIGMLIGFFVYVLYRLVRKPDEVAETGSQRNSARWAPWNDRNTNGNSDNEQLRNGVGSGSIRRSITALSMLCIYGCSGWGLFGIVSSCESRSMAQEPLTRISEIFQVVIPMDDAGNLAGNNVLVSNDLLKLLRGNGESDEQIAIGTHPYSAKHVLRLRSRGRVFSAADEVSMTYEFLVGEDLSPVRFPINTDQLQSVRFSVDGLDVGLSSKVRRQGSEWIWTPDKPGKRTVQITAQPILRTAPEQLKEPIASPAQQIEISLIPVANATMEIDADPQLLIDVVSRGRVVNPTAGRFTAMLGAIDRFQCKVNVGSIGGPVVSGGETPVMHTELFIQNEILQAKTIIEFPKNMPVSREIEIEADLLWLPVGTQWGDAQWVGLRPSSTLSRRRYVLEWNSTNSSTTPTATARDRQISVIWIPQSTAQSLNVLFAECRVRGTRLGTLRYARAPGANWSIEGINTWVPAINAKDNLDWPELNTNPIAAKLRIPTNGGFGILKTNTERPQARVATKWSITDNEESILSHIELLGGNSASDAISFDLESGFAVTEVYNRTGPIRFLQQQLNGKVHVHLLVDRKPAGTSDLWVQARRALPANARPVRNVAADVDTAALWNAIPWPMLAPGINSEQTLEVLASEDSALLLDPTTNVPVVGKGLSQPLTVLTRSSMDSRESSGPTQVYQHFRRNDKVEGQLLLSYDVSTKEVLLQGRLNQNLYTRPSFVLQVPVLLKDRWFSDSRIVSLQCPDPNIAWIQVHLAENPSEQKNMSSISIRFSLPSEASLSEFELLSKIHALNSDEIAARIVRPNDSAQDIPGSWQVASSEISQQLVGEFGLASNTVILERTGSEEMRKPDLFVRDRSGVPAVSLSVHRLATSESDLDLDFHANDLLLESRYLLPGNAPLQSSATLMAWELPDGLTVAKISVDGQQIPFDVQGNRLSAEFVQAGLCSEILVQTRHRISMNSESRSIVNTPTLLGEEKLTLFVESNTEVDWISRGQPVPLVLASVSKRVIAEEFLSLLGKSLELSRNQVRNNVYGSDWDRWHLYWNQRSYDCLLEWSRVSTAAEQNAFGSAVQRWHSQQVSGTTAQVPNVTRIESLSASVRSTDLDRKTKAASEINQVSSIEANPLGNRWISLGACLVMLLAMYELRQPLSSLLVHRPWWCLLGLGGLAWMMTGSLLPALVLGVIGLAALVDCYALISERLRRSGLHGLRSL